MDNFMLRTNRGPERVSPRQKLKNGTAGDNGTASGILNQPVLDFQDETPAGRHFVW